MDARPRGCLIRRNLIGEINLPPRDLEILRRADEDLPDEPGQCVSGARVAAEERRLPHQQRLPLGENFAGTRDQIAPPDRIEPEEDECGRQRRSQQQADSARQMTTPTARYQKPQRAPDPDRQHDEQCRVLAGKRQTGGRAEAERLGIRVQQGQPVRMQTANGVAEGWRVRLDSVRIGALEQRNVEAIITNEPMPYVLLGNSFLKPYEMTRKGNELLLQKR